MDRLRNTGDVLPHGCGLVSWRISLHQYRGLRFLEAVEEELSRTMVTIVEVVKVMIGTGRPWKMLEDEGW